MTNGRCGATYTLQELRLTRDTGRRVGDLGEVADLFDADGVWDCPRASVGDTGRCAFHLDSEERADHGITDAELSRRAVAELRGQRPLPPDRKPGEFVGVDVGEFVISDVDLMGDRGVGDTLTRPNRDGDTPTRPSGDVDRPPVYVVGSTLDQLVVDDATLGRNLVVDGATVLRDRQTADTDVYRDPGRGQESAEYADHTVLVRNSRLDDVTLSATRVRGQVEVSGETRIRSLDVRDGTFTNSAISVKEGASVERRLAVEGERTRISGVTVGSGAEVGVDAGDTNRRTGVVVSGVDNPETTVTVTGSETAVGELTVEQSRIDSVFVRGRAAVSEAVSVRDSTIEGDLKLSGADGRPDLSVGGSGTDVGVVVAEGSALRRLGVEDGATVSAVRLRGDGTRVRGEVDVAGAGTVVHELGVNTGTELASGLRVRAGARVTERVRVDDATVERASGVERAGAIVVCDPDTRVNRVAICGSNAVNGLAVVDGATAGTVRVSGDSLAGLVVVGATVEDGIELDDAGVAPIGRGSCDDVTTDAAGTVDGERVAMLVADATVAAEVAVTGGHVEGSVALVRATVRELVVGDGARIGGAVAVRAETSVERSLTLRTDLTLGGPLSVGDGATLNGDLAVLVEDDETEDDDRTIEFESDRGIVIDGGRVVGDVRLEAGIEAERHALTVRDADISGTVRVADATIAGNVAVEDSSVVRKDVRILGSTDVSGVLAVTDAAVVQGAVHVDCDRLDSVAVIDASVGRRLTIVGSTTVDGTVSLQRDAAVDGDIVVGSVPQSGSGAGEADTRTRIGGGIELGDVDDTHPTSGGVSVGGTFAVTGAADIEGRVRLSDVVVDEDVYVVGEGARPSVGEVVLVDCLVSGKVRLDRADLDAVSLHECRVGETVRVGPVDRGPDRQGDETAETVADGGVAAGPVTDWDVERTNITGELSIDSTPVAENVSVHRATLGGVELCDAIVEGRVTLSTVDIDGEVVVEETHVGEHATVSAGLLGGLDLARSVVDRRLVVGANGESLSGAAGLVVVGEFSVESVTVGDDLVVDCRVETAETSGRSSPRLRSVDIDGSVELRPRLDAPGRVSLRDSMLPGGELVVTAPSGGGVERTDSSEPDGGHTGSPMGMDDDGSPDATEDDSDSDDTVWYDLRGATLGDVAVTFEEGATGSTALDHLLLLETRFDGFQFSALEGGIDSSDGRIHTLGNDGAATRLAGLATADERLQPGRRWLYWPGRLCSWLSRAEAGYRSDDPPPAVLERTYLNAKNGASEVGDEDIAGEFFKREKRYRRRSYWERLCRVTDESGDDSVASPTRLGALRARLASVASDVGTARDWFANLAFDWLAKYGESPGRVVIVSGTIIGVFALLFGLLLDQPPYGDQYLGSGLLPGDVALWVQPLTLSIESFVTLVLVGPADQRLTPLVHLLGQLEGFFGVFLVALFVFTLTRSVRR